MKSSKPILNSKIRESQAKSSIAQIEPQLFSSFSRKQSNIPQITHEFFSKQARQKSLEAKFEVHETKQKLGFGMRKDSHPFPAEIGYDNTLKKVNEFKEDFVLLFGQNLSQGKPGFHQSFYKKESHSPPKHPFLSKNEKKSLTQNPVILLKDRQLQKYEKIQNYNLKEKSNDLNRSFYHARNWETEESSLTRNLKQNLKETQKRRFKREVSPDQYTMPSDLSRSDFVNLTQQERTVYRFTEGSEHDERDKQSYDPRLRSSLFFSRKEKPLKDASINLNRNFRPKSQENNILIKRLPLPSHSSGLKIQRELEAREFNQINSNYEKSDTVLKTWSFHLDFKRKMVERSRKRILVKKNHLLQGKNLKVAGTKIDHPGVSNQTQNPQTENDTEEKLRVFKLRNSALYQENENHGKNVFENLKTEASAENEIEKKPQSSNFQPHHLLKRFTRVKSRSIDKAASFEVTNSFRNHGKSDIANNELSLSIIGHAEKKANGKELNIKEEYDIVQRLLE